MPEPPKMLMRFHRTRGSTRLTGQAAPVATFGRWSVLRSGVHSSPVPAPATDPRATAPRRRIAIRSPARVFTSSLLPSDPVPVVRRDYVSRSAGATLHARVFEVALTSRCTEFTTLWLMERGPQKGPRGTIVEEYA